MTVRAAVGKLWPSLKLVSMATNWIKMQSQCVHIMCVTLSPILEGGPMIWIYRLLVPILPACVSHPLKCNRKSCCRQAVDKQNGWIDKLSEYGQTSEVSRPICTWWWWYASSHLKFITFSFSLPLPLSLSLSLCCFLSVTIPPSLYDSPLATGIWSILLSPIIQGSQNLFFAH